MHIKLATTEKLNLMLLGLPQFVLNSMVSETLSLGFKIQDLACQVQVLVSHLTEFSNQDWSWY